MPVVPTPEQIAALSRPGADGPIVMVNLLKYHDRAAYSADRPEAKENLSGREAYRRYGTVALQHVTAAGGRVVWAGPQKLVVIGDETNEWDDVVCVFYPSRKAFLAMIANQDYLAAHHHREAALERAALLCCEAGTAA